MTGVIAIPKSKKELKMIKDVLKAINIDFQDVDDYFCANPNSQHLPNETTKKAMHEKELIQVENITDFIKSL